MDSFEVLLDTHGFSWETMCFGNVPHSAVPGGKDGGDTLYIGRVSHNGSVTIGKVHPSHKCIYFPYGGREERSDCYEVLKRG